MIDRYFSYVTGSDKNSWDSESVNYGDKTLDEILNGRLKEVPHKKADVTICGHDCGFPFLLAHWIYY